MENLYDKIKLWEPWVKFRKFQTFYIADDQPDCWQKIEFKAVGFAIGNDYVLRQIGSYHKIP